MIYEINWILIAITCVFMVFDIITGFTAAAKNGELDSKIMKNGLFHKIGFVGVIALAVLIEFAAAYGAMEYADVNISVPLLPFVCGYIIVTEIVSVLENLIKLNPEIANEKLLKLFGKEVKQNGHSD